MKHFHKALALVLAFSLVLGAEETTTVEVQSGAAVVKSSSGEVSAKAGETVVVSEQQQKLQEALQKKVSLEFIDTPLVDAMGFLQKLSGANIILDPKVVAEDQLPAITLKVTDMSLRLVLDWICRLVECEWTIRDHAVFVTKRQLKQQNVGAAQGKAQSFSKITVSGKTIEVSGDGGTSTSVLGQNGKFTIQCGDSTLTGDSISLKCGDKTYDISKSNTVKVTVENGEVKVETK